MTAEIRQFTEHALVITREAVPSVLQFTEHALVITTGEWTPTAPSGGGGGSFDRHLTNYGKRARRLVPTAE